MIAGQIFGMNGPRKTMEFLQNILRMSDAEVHAISADMMKFIKWAAADAFPAVAFSASMLLFVYAGFFVAGWL